MGAQPGDGNVVAAERLTSAWIDVPVDLAAYTVRLFSDWSARASTTLRANLKAFTRGQNCRARGVGAPEFDNLDAAGVAGTPLDGLITGNVNLIAGCDRFRHANVYDDLPATERLRLPVQQFPGRGAGVSVGVAVRLHPGPATGGATPRILRAPTRVARQAGSSPWFGPPRQAGSRPRGSTHRTIP